MLELVLEHILCLNFCVLFNTFCVFAFCLTFVLELVKNVLCFCPAGSMCRTSGTRSPPSLRGRTSAARRTCYVSSFFMFLMLLFLCSYCYVLIARSSCSSCSCSSSWAAAATSARRTYFVVLIVMLLLLFFLCSYCYFSYCYFLMFLLLCLCY